MSNQSPRNQIGWLYCLTFVILVGIGGLAYVLMTGVGLMRMLDRRWDVVSTRPGASPRPTVTAPAVLLTVLPTVDADMEHTTRPVDAMVMVYIPAGEFLMGAAPGPSVASDERPPHVVYLDGYWIDRTEVTNAMFQKFLEETSYAFDGVTLGSANVHPVVFVNWFDAVAYCEWAGGSLPTEAQWEKAARGTDGRIYPWGNQFDGGRLNFCDRNCNYPHAEKGINDDWMYSAPVGNYPEGASPYDVLDLAGNVSEWVFDWYLRDYYAGSPERNPTGPESGTYHVVRGGTFFDGSWGVRTTGRIQFFEEKRENTVGFRCVR